MKNIVHHLFLLGGLSFGPFAFAQTLTEANSIPAVGTVENRSYYQDGSASGLATTGTGNTWNAMGVTPFGISRTVTYRVPGDSPYAATYPTTTLCAEDNSGTPPNEWRHFHVSTAIAELLGASADEFVGGRTYCTYPFLLGNNFTDGYTIAGTPYTDVVDYVASGEITAPWGTIPNVVMFQTNGGPYTFYQSTNLLDAIGSYMPGFGLDLWQVETGTGIHEGDQPALGIWPVPADDRVTIAAPLNGRMDVTVIDATGRSVLAMTSTQSSITLDVRSFGSGVYTVLATDRSGRRASGRMVVR